MDTVSIQGVGSFPLHSEIPGGIEMMLYKYYFQKGEPNEIQTLPRGKVSVTFKKKDKLFIRGEEVYLNRYTVTGINWGKRTIWLDNNNNLIAVVFANTQFRELIRKGYEEGLPHFIAGNVEEQMEQLDVFTKSVPAKFDKITAFIGGDIVTGLKDETEKNMTILVENGIITKIGKRGEVEIPLNASVIDVTGKTLIPGLWDMHAHSNQVQWSPAYLAGGITTIRDCGNEREFAVAFRDAIEKNGKLGPHVLLGGMTDGEGITGNGIIRARTPEEAVEVVEMYYNLGYDQIKIYNGVKKEIVKILTEEAHKRGLTVTGHVPLDVGNAKSAIELGMDHLNHRALILSILFPNENISDLGRSFVSERTVTAKQIDDAIKVLLEHKTVLDPTIVLDIVRSIPLKSTVETVVPDAYRIAPELFEGKRFQKGINKNLYDKAQLEITKSMEILGKFQKAGVPIVAGTDNAIPVFSLYTEIETYHHLGNFSRLEALQSATIVAARSMGLGDITGTIEVGKEADIAILEKNPLDEISNIRSVRSVVTNGQYYDCDQLWPLANFLTK
jgi:imidazolonepropionase-like amidohydrolase